MKKRIVTRVLVLLLLALATVAFFYYNQKEPIANLLPEIVAPSPTPAKTTSWKNYTSQALGLTIDYPGSWPEPTERILATTNQIEFNGGKMIIMGGVFYNQDKRRGLTASELITLISNKKRAESTKIDNYPAFYLKIRENDLQHQGVNPFNIVTIQKGETVYEIDQSLSIGQFEQENEQKTFDQMLTSLRFLN